MKRIHYMIVYTFVAMLIFLMLSSCSGENYFKFDEVILNNTIANQHCIYKGEAYINKYKIVDNKLVVACDSLNNTTVENGMIDISVEALTCDGENIYYLITDWSYIDKDMKIQGAILRYDGKDTYEIARWDRPTSGQNNRSLKIYGEYIYFFCENNNDSNYICRANIKIGGMEILSINNSDTIYSGIFFIDDNVFVQYGNNLYKTDIDHLSVSELTEERLFIENIRRICVIGDSIYYIRSSENNDTMNMYTLKLSDNEEKLLIENISSILFQFIGDNIYYAKPDLEEIGRVMIDGKEMIVYNQYHGSLYRYNISSGETTDVVNDFDIVFEELYNVSDDYILALAYTNEQYVSAVNGASPQYMLVPTDGSEAIILEMGA